MHIGVIGLGRMGTIVADRLQAGGMEVTGFDQSATARERADGHPTVGTLDELLDTLASPYRLWLMVPAGDPVDAVLDELTPRLDDQDIVIDGGNSHFADSEARAMAIDAAYLDCGTSGGPAGADRGFSLMIGGPAWAYDTMTPAFDAVATGPAGHDRFGPNGAGHYVKMIHNGIEYAMMQAYGEGFELLANGRYDLDLGAIASTWSDGAVIRSWLLELCREAFQREGNDLGPASDYVGGGSTGAWTVHEAIDQEVPVPMIYTALAERFGSRTPERFARRLANQLRHEFGEHPVATGTEQPE